LNCRLAAQGVVEHVAQVFLREMLVRVAQNAESKKNIFRTIDWVLPWLARLDCLVDIQLLEVTRFVFTLSNGCVLTFMSVTVFVEAHQR